MTAAAELLAESAGPCATLPAIAVAGPVASEEEMLSVQQIAAIVRWMRFFTDMTARGRGPDPDGRLRGGKPAQP